MHMQIHKLSFWRSFYCLLKGNMEKDASLSRFGFFFFGRGKRDKGQVSADIWRVVTAVRASGLRLLFLTSGRNQRVLTTWSGCKEERGQRGDRIK